LYKTLRHNTGDLDCQYKSAFVLAHNLREALGAVVQSGPELSGVVHVDGMYTGTNGPYARMQSPGMTWINADWHHLTRRRFFRQHRAWLCHAKTPEYRPPTSV
jgi:uncharacterized NAD(P)/FAD-binding protein YdhS